MGRLFLITLEGNIYSCKYCHAHLALYDHIISMARNHLQLLEGLLTAELPLSLFYLLKAISFHCRHGKAYIVDKVLNVTVGEKKDRMMMTGMHTVVDIFCVGCGAVVGWKYVSPYSSRYKVLGPDGSLYSIGQEAQIGIIDADDV